MYSALMSKPPKSKMVGRSKKGGALIQSSPAGGEKIRAKDVPPPGTLASRVTWKSVDLAQGCSWLDAVCLCQRCLAGVLSDWSMPGLFWLDLVSITLARIHPLTKSYDLLILEDFYDP